MRDQDAMEGFSEEEGQHQELSCAAREVGKAKRRRKKRPLNSLADHQQDAGNVLGWSKPGGKGGTEAPEMVNGD